MKALHLFFVMSWFTGLFYLPRIYVNLAMATQADEYARLLQMARKLYRFMLPLAVLALSCGGWLAWHLGFGAAWLHAKLTLVAMLIGYHCYCGKIYRDFAAERNQRSHQWFRWFNEAPTILLLAIVILVVVKPF
jgi:putative membrane protein